MLVTMVTPISSHVKDKNSIFTRRNEDMIFLVKGKILVFHQYLYNNIESLLRQPLHKILMTQPPLPPMNTNHRIGPSPKTYGYASVKSNCIHPPCLNRYTVELAKSTSLEFEFLLQFSCGSPLTELSDFCQSTRSRNKRELM